MQATWKPHTERGDGFPLLAGKALHLAVDLVARHCDGLAISNFG